MNVIDLWCAQENFELIYYALLEGPNGEKDLIKDGDFTKFCKQVLKAVE